MLLKSRRRKRNANSLILAKFCTVYMYFDWMNKNNKKEICQSAMSVRGVARGRLAEERKAWRKSHPHGFVAKPEMLPDGTVNLMLWHCKIPGKPRTDWEGGYYPLTMIFSEDYPSKPPLCKFPYGFFHPNVYRSGDVCLSILSNEWKPAITVQQILAGIQELLNQPNFGSCAQMDVLMIFKQDPAGYRRRILEEAKRYPNLFNNISQHLKRLILLIRKNQARN